MNICVMPPNTFSGTSFDVIPADASRARATVVPAAIVSTRARSPGALGAVTTFGSSVS
jgi:hypothetical protein